MFLFHSIPQSFTLKLCRHCSNVCGEWGSSLNPLTPGTFCQNFFFFYILVVLKLDRDQISFSLVENALVTRQLTVLATGIAFKTFWPRHAQKSKFWDTKVTYGFRLFDFWIFFPFPFPLGFFFAAVIGLLPGLLGVKKGFRKIHRGGQFLPWSS